LLVFGILFIISFVVWEKWFALITFMPYSLLLDRTVFGACLLSTTVFLSYASWASYFSFFLQVVNGLSVEHASYVVQSYTLVSVHNCIAVGTRIRYTGRIKPITLYYTMPMSVLGQGLMIYFRQPGSHIGYVVMCQILMATDAGTIIIVDKIAILAAAAHHYAAVAIRVVSLFGWRTHVAEHKRHWYQADERASLVKHVYWSRSEIRSVHAIFEGFHVRRSSCRARYQPLPVPSLFLLKPSLFPCILIDSRCHLAAVLQVVLVLSHNSIVSIKRPLRNRQYPIG
jgi:hypothetical protein